MQGACRANAKSYSLKLGQHFFAASTPPIAFFNGISTSAPSSFSCVYNSCSSLANRGRRFGASPIHYSSKLPVTNKTDDLFISPLRNMASTGNNLKHSENQDGTLSISNPTSVDTHSNPEMTENELSMTKDAFEIVTAAIRAVDPYVAVRDRIKINANAECANKLCLVANVDRDGSSQLTYDLSKYDKIKIFSFGKASAAMALAAAEIVSDYLTPSSTPSSSTDKKEHSNTKTLPLSLNGITIIKDDHATPSEIQTLEQNYNIRVKSASHPVPDARSISAANEILQSASESDERTLILACISGGGSSLFCAPRDPLSLQDLMDANSALLASGMPIEKMNVIRKRLERGKGGRLAASAHPATLLTLVLSDIIGDPLDLIASGPTVPDDGSGWEEAWGLVEEYGLDGSRLEGEALPKAVLELLRMGVEGNLEDSTKSSHPAFSSLVSANDATNTKSQRYSETVLVGNNYAAAMAAADEAEKRGYNPIVLGTRVEGEASVVAGMYVAMAEHLSRQRSQSNDCDRAPSFPITSLPAALIAGGETTVTLPQNCKGKGGRNQELALFAAIKLKELNLRDVVLVSVGTDGTDGPTDAAGAVVDGGTVDRVENALQTTLTSKDDPKSVDQFTAKEAMKNHDAYTFFNAVKESEYGPLVRTGPTGTNVADICITLLR